ncbi:MAG: 23S rRNA (guanosine(2251)-2'-O)-methyltransferase RlmB [Clostridia bacterium]|nr:23S rRNA (guanosine(2251)-2'-O)-methyltransferase RlmB [Clostridia bacterium]
MENKGKSRFNADKSSRQPRKEGNFKRTEQIFKERDEIDSLGVVIGRNAVAELLKSNRTIDKIYVRKGVREGSLTLIVAQAVEKRIPVVEVEPSKLDFMSGGANHQGVVAMAALKDYVSVDDILDIAKERGEKPLIVIADCIEDPHNLGALIRCAECAGAHGIIIPKRHAVGITPAVYKSSAGAIEHMAIAKVSNIATAIDDLKKKGVWIFASEAGGTPYYETDYDCACAIVLGSEGNGVGRLIKEKSDFIISIPMYGKVNSLNVSTAASVILCHVARMQRG